MIKDQHPPSINSNTSKSFQLNLSMNKQLRNFGMVSESYTEEQQIFDEPLPGLQKIQEPNINMQQQMKRQQKGKECMRIKCQIESSQSQSSPFIQDMEQQPYQSSQKIFSYHYSSIQMSSSRYNLRQRKRQKFDQFKPKKKIKLEKQEPKLKSMKTRIRSINIVPAHFIQTYEPNEKAKKYYPGINTSFNPKKFFWQKIQQTNIQQIAKTLTDKQKNFKQYRTNKHETKEKIKKIKWANYSQLPQLFYVCFENGKQGWVEFQEVLKNSPQLVEEFNRKQFENLSDKIPIGQYSRFA